MAEIEYFPPEHLSLMAEIRRHPPLKALLDSKYNSNAPKDLAEWYGEVAAYCDIAVDGYYGAQDFLNLARLLTDKLYEKRTSLVIIGPTDV